MNRSCWRFLVLCCRFTNNNTLWTGRVVGFWCCVVSLPPTQHPVNRSCCRFLVLCCKFTSNTTPCEQVVLCCHLWTIVLYRIATAIRWDWGLKEVDACGIILYRRYLRAHTKSRTTLRFILLDGGDLLHTVCVVEPGVPVDINANFGRWLTGRSSISVGSWFLTCQHVKTGRYGLFKHVRQGRS